MLLKIVNYIHVIIICKFCLALFLVNNSFAQLTYTAGTYTNNTNVLTATTAIQGSGDALTVTNNASLTSTGADGMNSSATATTFINNGTIHAYEAAMKQLSGSSISFTNNGAIISRNNNAGSRDARVGMRSNGSGTFINNGTIGENNPAQVSGIKRGMRLGLDGQGGNYVIKNTGVIKTHQVDIEINAGTVTSLTNSEGGASNVLTYAGKLPTNYYVIINSLTDYGKLSVTSSKSGKMSFNIGDTSAITAGIYEDVLTGISYEDLSSLTGTYGAFNWTLSSCETNCDLTFSSNRSAYNQTVTNAKFITTASKFENMRTAGKNPVLTTKLDVLSAAQLETYLKKSQGLTKVKSNTQAIQSQSNFKTALSTITAPKSFSPAGRGPSPITNLTRTNVGNLTLADLKTNELYASIQPANFSSDDKLFNQASNQSGTNVLEFLKSNKNRDLISNDLKESGFFLRTFGSITNYAAINSDDNSYNNDSYGFFGGLQHKIDENLYQGYSLGFSTNKLTLDASEGNTKTNTIHADIYRKIEEKEYGATISLGTYVSFIDNVRNISETSEILKSSPMNSGIDLKLELVKNVNLFGLNFYPSVSITGSYGLVENYKEKGGSGSALEVKAHNVLATKPEIGFRFENNFVETEKMTEGLNFSLFASRQKYHDGHTSTSSLIGENDFTGSTLPKIKDDFLTAGLGYAAKNIDEKSDLNFNFFYTQSTNNALNSSLFSISYNRVF